MEEKRKRGRPPGPRRIVADVQCQICSALFQPRPQGLNRFCSLPCANASQRKYGKGFIDTLRRGWNAGKSAATLGIIHGLTKDQVIGIIHRNEGFVSKPTAIGYAEAWLVRRAFMRVIQSAGCEATGDRCGAKCACLMDVEAAIQKERAHDAV